ncbi:hypothetical protein GJ744_009810 [Endocarpon pusillum]|uniref:Uncharacterized protein n=1 Tax=Endocarpon pusillum TaxID=364733 RepID=A0A8H7AS74_9EURO|nr:hypothetical protein GJ744_009810 [Endocarpon pusillum]
MYAHPDEENLTRWLDKQKFEEDKARKEQFEKDKALKDRKPTPWSREAWQAVAARNRAVVVKPERQFPIIITSSTGPFTTPQILQEAAGLSSLPEVQWMTRTSFSASEEGSRDPDGEEPEKVQYCDVNLKQRLQVQEYSDGEENALIWFQGKKRAAWLARSVKAEE